MADPSTVVPPTTTCEICRCFQFNDQALGGSVATTEDGLNRLQFKLNRRLKLTSSCYLLETYPDLPKISESVKNGCTFCDFLLKVLRSADVTSAFQDMFRDLGIRKLPFTINTAYLFDLTGAPEKSPYQIKARDFILNKEVSLRQLRFTIDLDNSVVPDINWPVTDLPVTFDLFCNIHSSVDSEKFRLYFSDKIGCHDANRSSDEDNQVASWLGLLNAPDSDSWGQSIKDGLNWMDSVLSSCINHANGHDRCYKSVSPEPSTGYLPTRLIDISGSSDALRLVQRIDIMKEVSTGVELPRYVALSYCWGVAVDTEHVQLLTTSSNQSEMMAGFSLRSLPKAIQDAIAVARNFSTPYLWVDTICILQDSEADWARESKELVNIYGACFFTICSLAPSSHMSFLNPERPSVSVPFQSSLDQNICGNYTITYSTLEIDNLGWNHTFSQLYLPQSRWFSRGWTYLELLASRRAFLINRPYLTYICPYYDQPVGRDITWADSRRSLYDMYGGKEAAYLDWALIVNNYVNRTFSFPQDRLPALSGVAGVFANVLQDEYHAGVWKDGVSSTLIWHYGSRHHLLGAVEALEQLEHPNPYVAPSWSWASRRYIYFTFLKDWESVCRVEMSTDLFDDKEPFGRVKGGQLVITGRTYDLLGTSILLAPDDEDTRGIGGDYNLVLKLKEGYLRCELDFIVNRMELDGRFKLVLLSQGTGEKWSFGFAGLILHEAARGGAYIRVGSFLSLEEHKTQDAVDRMFCPDRVETVVII